MSSKIIGIFIWDRLYLQDNKNCDTCGKVYKTTDRSIIGKHKENCKLWKNCWTKTETGLFSCKFCPRKQKKLHQIWSHLKEIHSARADILAKENFVNTTNVDKKAVVLKFFQAQKF